MLISATLVAWPHRPAPENSARAGTSKNFIVLFIWIPLLSQLFAGAGFWRTGLRSGRRSRLWRGAGRSPTRGRGLRCRRRRARWSRRRAGRRHYAAIGLLIGRHDGRDDVQRSVSVNQVIGVGAAIDHKRDPVCRRVLIDDLLQFGHDNGELFVLLILEVLLGVFLPALQFRGEVLDLGLSRREGRRAQSGAVLRERILLRLDIFGHLIDFGFDG